MLDLIAHGTLKTDGSERHVAFTSDGQNGNLVAHPRSHLDNSGFVHDDFAAFQKGKAASKLAGEFMHIKMRESESDN